MRAEPQDIGFTDGIMGSTGLDKLKEQSKGGDPGVAGRVETDRRIGST